MRIAHITATFPPYRGGTGNVCWQHAALLARRDHEVHVFTAAHADTPAVEYRDGVTVHRLKPLLRVGNAPVLIGLLRALRGFDIVHLHYPFFGGELSTLMASLTHTPLVLTYHQDVLLRGPMVLIERALRATAGRWTLRSAARVLFTSVDYGNASYVRKLLHGRESAIDALPNGVDPRAFFPIRDRRGLRSIHSIAPDDRIVLLVAGLDRAHYFKGVEVLLSALTRLPSSVRAIIVGDGDLRPRYAATAADLGIGDRVAFAGRVPDAHLPDYYRLADLTVLPSTTMGEAFGLVLLESLACETPVIASDLPGVRTVVDAEIDGLLVAPGDPSALADAIGRVLRDEPSRQAMGRAGRAKVTARYDWEDIGAQLEAIYEHVIAEQTIAQLPEGLR